MYKQRVSFVKLDEAQELDSVSFSWSKRSLVRVVALLQFMLCYVSRDIIFWNSIFHYYNIIILHDRNSFFCLPRPLVDCIITSPASGGEPARHTRIFSGHSTKHTRGTCFNNKQTTDSFGSSSENYFRSSTSAQTRYSAALSYMLSLNIIIIKKCFWNRKAHQPHLPSRYQSLLGFT